MDTLLDRFLRYVKIESTAQEDTDNYPSSPGQLEMGKLLTEELRALRLADVTMDEHGIVMGTVPGNVDGAPTIALVAHVDTSPEFTAANVKPQVIRNYDGKDIALPGDRSRVIRVDETEELADLKGKTLITTDGTTLLGADDKAGVAVVMHTAQHLMAHPEVERGPVRVVFTCDEEIGHGVDHVDLRKVGAVAAYTLDGEGAGNVEAETFSADLATVTVTGVNIHPGYAKDKMVNAIRLAGAFVSRLPWQRLSPETTADRESFMHPYVIDGGVPEVRIKVLLRSFDTAELPKQAELLHQTAAGLQAEFPQARIDVAVAEQYRNMADALRKEPRVVDLAFAAFRALGIEARRQSIRGGTDGSRLSELGLPTPNLSTGMHNFHSPLEFACLDEMETAHQAVVELLKLWGKQRAQ